MPVASLKFSRASVLLGVLAGATGLFASACSISTTGNSITLKTKPEYADSSQPEKTATKDWNGEPISIINDGVNPLTGTGGVVINVDPSATRIKVKATFAARADTEAEAQSSIRDAIQTLTIDESNGKFAIACHHGQAHGSSDVAASGCKLMTVTIPAGSASLPHSLTVGSGAGDISFSAAVTVKALTVDNNGLGTTTVKVRHTAGATIAITGEDKISVGLPTDFAAQSVSLKVDGDPTGRILTGPFTGMTDGAAFGSSTGAAASFAVRSKGPFDSDTIELSSF